MQYFSTSLNNGPISIVPPKQRFKQFGKVVGDGVAAPLDSCVEGELPQACKIGSSSDADQAAMPTATISAHIRTAAAQSIAASSTSVASASSGSLILDDFPANVEVHTTNEKGNYHHVNPMHSNVSMGVGESSVGFV